MNSTGPKAEGAPKPSNSKEKESIFGTNGRASTKDLRGIARSPYGGGLSGGNLSLQERLEVLNKAFRMDSSVSKERYETEIQRLEKEGENAKTPRDKRVLMSGAQWLKELRAKKVA